MLLENKNAVIYGAGGAIGAAVARAFAREGAKVFLTGRTLAKVHAVAEEISAAGGLAQTARVDALDETAIERHVQAGTLRRTRQLDLPATVRSFLSYEWDTRDNFLAKFPGGGRGTGVEPSPRRSAYPGELRRQWFLAEARLSTPYDLIFGDDPHGRLYNSAPDKARQA